jgi:hypothetical protein
MRNLLRAGAFLLALSLAPLASASAHDKHGRKRRHARRQVVKIHDDNRNPTPGVPRLVRRGRNPTAGAPRGSFAGTPSTFPTDEARRLGAEVSRGGDRGVRKSVGRRSGGGRGHGKH